MEKGSRLALSAQQVALGDAFLASLIEEHGEHELTRIASIWADLRSSADSTRRSGNPLQRPTRYYVPGLTTAPWWTRSTSEAVLEATTILEENFTAIRDELSEMRNAFVEYREANLAANGLWASFPLRKSSATDERAKAACPATTAIIDSIPRVGDMAMFSALNPGTHIPPHCGPWNTRLTIHLGLIVPEGCAFRVGSTTERWTEGKCLVFDDSFEHEVWHRGKSSRFVLLVDLWHPDITELEMFVLRSAEQMLRDAGAPVAQREAQLGANWWV